ncbi:MAG: very short patch repair endonuclease [Nitrospirae bacterium]|nr:very short patch repair endonuclease [Nitrospirota bacterium]
MDNLTPEQRRKNMQNIRSVNTKPELLIAKELRKRKIYFARNVNTILGKPDFVFRRKKVAVFIDSDFWHGHSLRCIMPKSNLSYWEGKIERNRQRDKAVNKQLKSMGWQVIRIWEFDLKINLEKSLNIIISAIKEP